MSFNGIDKKIPKPGRIYAGSPGTLLDTTEQRKVAKNLESRDVIMSVQAIEDSSLTLKGNELDAAFESKGNRCQASGVW